MSERKGMIHYGEDMKGVIRSEIEWAKARNKLAKSMELVVTRFFYSFHICQYP